MPGIESVLRGMAWQRAKGELQSMLCTLLDTEEEFRKLNDLIDEFVEKVENEGPGL